MPELPEVETVRRQLEPELVGKRIESATVLDERLTRPEPPGALERAVGGSEVTAVARRGKYLLLGLEGGRTLALHLRMTGNLLLRDPDAGATADLMKSEPLGGRRRYESAPEPSYVRARFELDDGRVLLFTDVRRFGQAVVLDAGDQLDDFFAARLGLEPLSGELTPERLLELAAGRKAPLKSFLLTQSRIAGLGNIYADEALWRARLHPLSPAGSMKLEHAQRLVDGIGAAPREKIRVDDRVETLHFRLSTAPRVHPTATYGYHRRQSPRAFSHARGHARRQRGPRQRSRRSDSSRSA